MAKKILVVDDDVQTVKLVGLVLDRQGYEIVAARTGEQALKKVETEHPDLVVLDIMMPDMDGYEVSRRLRANPETANLPIMMFSAKGQVEDKVEGFDAGADDFLTKPIRPQELASRVETLLLRSSRGQPGGRPATPNVVGFLGAKGGVGTTTLAVNAAVTLAEGEILKDTEDQTNGGGRVILAETRPGIATAYFQLGLPERDGLGKILERPIAQIDTAFIEAQLDEHQSGLLVLGGRIDPPGGGELLSPDHADVIVRCLSAPASYLLLDLAVGLGEVNRRLLSHCRHVVATIEPDNMALALAERLLAEMNQSLNIPRHKISLALIKRNRSATTFTQEEIEERLAHNLIGVIPPAPELAFQSTSQQRPMVMLDPDGLIVRQYRTFVSDLIEAL